MLPTLEINRLELCVVALRRSGHHAIVEWLLRHLDGDGCFINDCRLECSPFVSSKGGGRATGKIDLERERPGALTPKDYLVHNYENRNLTKVFSESRLESWDEFVGTSRRRVHLLMLRDPFNHFASLVRRSEGHTPGDTLTYSPETVRRCVVLWKRYAQEYLGLTDIIPGEKIGVSYNAWFTDQRERKRLAEMLDLEFTDEGIDEVAAWGPSKGSSFDGFAYNGRAREMGVLERFRKYEDDPFYLGLFDREIIDLSQRIFGEIPGTERVVRAVPRFSWRELLRRARSSVPPVPSRTGSRS
jgi:hypothetical protein